ncbi:unnamed protein product [Adineta ricciae]|uniref:NAD(P)(+)--arginine ADP-ribosyltransferase n=1 Tax=Adineta ricciae TaxID=249248 RepID=A0A814JF21_ADIRI|nr:unnamed protein product [Adineta ricciae]CAF1572659.1 unnamed protein product [Adineta ricciae]
MASGTRLPSDRQRFLDVNQEPDKLALPLYIPVTESNAGQLRLIDCVKPIEKLGVIPNLLNEVIRSLNSCQHPKDGLTPDESAALYLYSLPGAFYTTFNGALRNEDRTKSLPFHDYYKLFMLALKKLPSIQDTIWRGVTADLSDQYSPGSIHIWHAASSCTDQIHVTDTFLDKTKHRTLFSIKCSNGKSIKNHSHFPKESETILPPGTFIRVKGRSNPAENLFIVICEETTLTSEEMNALAEKGITAALPGSMPGVAPKLLLVWFHPNIGKSKDNIKIQEKLRPLFPDGFQTFQSPEECELFIKQKTNDRIIFIVGGQFGQNFVPIIHNLAQLVSILVYCMDKEGHEKWAKNFTKIKGVFTQPKELINEVEQLKLQQELLITNQDESTPTISTPISGYELVPLQPLEVALQPVGNLIEDLDRNIWISKQHSKSSSHGLTHDEAASITIYTMEMDGNSLYRVLNKALRSENRDHIKPWLPYLKLFMTALNKLPSYQGVVWRGIQMDISNAYQRGTRGVWWGVTSATKDGSILENFMSHSSARVLFSIECKNGKYIREFSSYGEDNEVILMPGFRFEVTGVMKPADKMHIISLKEVDPFW